RIAGQGSGRYVIVLPRNAGLGLLRAADHLAAYIGQAEGTLPTINDEDEFLLSRNQAATVIVVGDESSNRLIGELAVRRSTSGKRGDGFTIRTIQGQNGSRLVIVVGESEHGARYGLWELLRTFIFEEGRLTLPDLNIT